mgnify:CR=1 FL=1
MTARPLYFDCSPGIAAMLTPALLALCPALELAMETPDRDTMIARLADREIVVLGKTWLGAEDLARAPLLEHIVFLGTGASSYVDLDAAAARGITVHVVPGYGSRAVAEHTLALIFACARQVARMDRDIRAGGFPSLTGMELEGKTLGLVGLGDIGTEVAKLGLALGMRIIGWTRSGDTRGARILLRSLDDVFRDADIVSLHVALSAGTRGLVDARRLALMKPGSILINTARGAIVDEAALVAALQQGIPASAGLDVFVDEPPRSDHALRRLDNVVLTGHAAFRTPEASYRLVARTFEIVNQLMAPIALANRT